MRHPLPPRPSAVAAAAPAPASRAPESSGVPAVLPPVLVLSASSDPKKTRRGIPIKRPFEQGNAPAVVALSHAPPRVRKTPICAVTTPVPPPTASFFDPPNSPPPDPDSFQKPSDHHLRPASIARGGPSVFRGSRESALSAVDDDSYSRGHFNVREQRAVKAAVYNVLRQNYNVTEISDVRACLSARERESRFGRTAAREFWPAVTAKSGVNRSVGQVYKHVKEVLANEPRIEELRSSEGRCNALGINYSRWADTEDAKLLQLVSELGRKWKEIEKRMGRVGVRERFRLLESHGQADVLFGSWTPEEEKIFLDILVKHHHPENPSDTPNTEVWTNLEDSLPARRPIKSIKQKWRMDMRRRWMAAVAMKNGTPDIADDWEPIRWTRDMDLEFLNTLLEEFGSAVDESEVRWSQIPGFEKWGGIRPNSRSCVKYVIRNIDDIRKMMEPKYRLSRPGAQSELLVSSDEEDVMSESWSEIEGEVQSQQVVIPGSLADHAQEDLPAKIDTLFNQALKKAVESGELLQPKGASGPVKINKEERAALAPKKKQPSATAAPKIEASDVKKKVAYSFFALGWIRLLIILQVVRGNPRQKSENAPIPAKVLVEKVSARSSAKPGRKAEKRKVVTPTKAKSTAKKTAAKPKAALPEPVVVVTVARRSVSAKEKAVVAKKSAKATAVKGSANERKSSGTPKTSAARRGLRSGKK
ncbi:RNA polymerase I enhancer binding protein [Entophlyctis luteolus]|nr:RNA polymerase I enhancer binding protein [Entophlyctis luteolus]